MIGWGRPTRLGMVMLALSAGACATFRHVQLVVQDAAGKPVPGARVSCASLSMNVKPVETDRRGRVDVPRAIGSQPLRWCQVRKVGYQRTLPFEVPERAGRIRITLRELQPGEKEAEPGSP